MAERRGTKALELWCRRMTEGYPGVKIDNMTTSWRDGLAFCAMIHHFRPDLIDFDKLNKADVYYNNELAFTTAEKYLGIPALLDAVDMAAYEVPDRLSILTYLSQFYQVFAAQDSPNRLKRPSSTASAEKAQINKTPGPPSKMAHVVGVPRRDPCQKCLLPVFLAERLAVGKQIYHRTCLKCARCGSQLTPGSFYETEVDGEYCCETCPDEEDLSDLAAGDTLLRNPAQAEGSIVNSGVNTNSPTAAARKSKTVRSSIADRLAFFEQNKKADEIPATAGISPLLQKSVTDEEKTKSLQRMESTAPAPSYRMPSALSTFLNDTIDTGSEQQSSSTTQMETSDTENESDAEDDEDESSLEQSLPALPQSQPPELVELRDNAGTSEAVQQKRFTATAQLQLALEEVPTTTTTAATEKISKEKVASVDVAEQSVFNSTSETLPSVEQVKSTKAEEEKNLLDSPTANESQSPEKNEIKLNLTSDSTTVLVPDSTDKKGGEHEVKVQNTEITENHPQKSHSEQPEQALTSPAINLDLSEANDNVQDVTKDKIADRNQIAVAAPIISNAQQMPRAQSRETVEDGSTERQSNAEMQMDTTGAASVEMRTKSLEDAATTERLSVVRARLQQFEVKANKCNINNDHNNDNENSANLASSIDNVTNKSVDKPTSNVNINVKLNEFDAENTTNNKQLNTEATLVEDPPVFSNAVKLGTDLMECAPTINLEDEAKLKAIEEDNTTIAAHNSSSKAVEVSLEANVEKIKDDSVEMTIETTPKTRKFAKSGQQTEVTPQPITPSKVDIETYPEDLNPFASDDDDDEVASEANKENIQRHQLSITPKPRTATKRTEQTTSPHSQQSQTPKLNPFDSSDDEIELEKPSTRNSTAASTPSSQSGKVPPPRPPPPRISRNPFGDEDEDMNFSRHSSLSSSLTKKTPVPTPRTNLSQSQTPTPEPTPRLGNKSAQSNSSFALQNCSDYYGSVNSLGSTHTPPNQQGLRRNSDVRGSNNSLTSSAGGTIRSRKSRKAPAPPAPSVKELFPSGGEHSGAADSSKASTPSSSTMSSPKLGRKKRPAPAPPKPARLDPGLLPAVEQSTSNGDATTFLSPPKNSLSYPLQCDISDSKLSDEEKALLEGKQSVDSNDLTESVSKRSSRRLIPLDASLLADINDPADVGLHADDDGGGKCDDVKQQQQQLRYRNEQEESNVVYRRVLMPPNLETPTRESNPLFDALHDRQLEKLKDNKEANNRNRQSQISASSGNEDVDVAAPYNKSAHGKWKRRKGPAPALPIPPRKVLQMLPLQEIRHELDIIEVQQQGLEKQGVILEKMIRDRCEGQNGELLGAVQAADTGDSQRSNTAPATENVQNTKEVEDLILQLFELVNEKNELFRRQAELMYLRRQHRLEQEQADLEYEIRVLMAQPERNKTDTDKSREEALIARLVEVVQLRNEVIECLEMDRLREAEEDLSIKQRLEMHTAQREGDADSPKTSAKLSKKEKKKQKESKKLIKSKKTDADKDADESELGAEKTKLKKKKKKLFF